MPYAVRLLLLTNALKRVINKVVLNDMKNKRLSQLSRWRVICAKLNSPLLRPFSMVYHMHICISMQSFRRHSCVKLAHQSLDVVKLLYNAEMCIHFRTIFAYARTTLPMEVVDWKHLESEFII